MKVKKSLENIFSIPYKIGGVKNINFSNPLIRSEFFEEADSHKKKDYNESDLFPFLVLPGKLSNKTYNHVSKLYSNYVNDLMNPEKLKAICENFKNNSNNNKDGKNVELASVKGGYYSKSYLKHFNSLFSADPNFSFNDWAREVKDKYELYTYNRSRKLNNNKIIFDKIFIHLNYKEDAFDLQSQKIKHTEHSPSKKFYVFNYKSKASPIARKFKVRLSFWIEASDLIIIEKNEANSHKIHKDEMHHMLIEFEDDIEELNYLNLFSRFSFVNLFRSMIDSRKKCRWNQTQDVLDKLKISDFDFFVGEKDNLNRSSDKDGYNEYFYIKFL